VPRSTHTLKENKETPELNKRTCPRLQLKTQE
jgi:hypothetical protein